MKSRNFRKAFSLVEVTIAIGILSFSMIAIMGLIPIALKTSRDSIEKNMELHILQAIQADLSSRAYSILLNSDTLYFDEEGELSDSTKARYCADYDIQASTPLPDGQSAEKLKVVKIEIQNLLTKQTKTNSIHLSDNGF